MCVLVCIFLADQQKSKRPGGETKLDNILWHLKRALNRDGAELDELIMFCNTYNFGNNGMCGYALVAF